MSSLLLLLKIFYRATLRVSARGLRGLYCRPVSVCPSVWLSVAFVYCIQTAEDIVKLLSYPDSPIILVFGPPTPIPNFKGNPFSGTLNTRGDENLRCSTVIAVYLGNGTREAHGCYRTLIGSHTWRINLCQFR